MPVVIGFHGCCLFTNDQTRRETLNDYERWRANLANVSVHELLRVPLPVVTPRLPEGRLYKYWPLEFIQGLIREGRLRIGTLDKFRASEDRLRGDRRDGQVTYTEAQRSTQTYDQLSPLARDAASGIVGRPAHADTVVFDRCVFWVDDIHPNAYAFCVSSELSRSAAGDYNACAAMMNPGRFFDIVTEHVTREILSACASAGRPDATVRSAFAPVRYLAGASAHEYGRINPGFVKDPYFRVEQEVRAVWSCDVLPEREFLDIVDPRLCDVLEQVTIPDP